MILEPLNDQQCLGQLVARARAELGQPRAYQEAARLGSPANVVRYLRSLPQLDDDGSYRRRSRKDGVQCDVWQRLRFMAPDPNCFERTLDALVLLEVLDPKTERVAVSVDEPERHTGIVEREPGGEWQALDLFPRRNADGRRRPSRWRRRNADDDREVGKTILHQLGRATLAMLGARDLVLVENGVQFAIQGSPRKVSKVRIVLEPDDSYAVEFYTGRGINIRPLAAYDGIYVDGLHELIEQETGLYTRLVPRQAAPRLRGAGRLGARNSTLQDVFGYVHPAGAAILGAFGQKWAADNLQHLEQSAGVLRRPSTPVVPGAHPAPLGGAMAQAGVAMSPAQAPPMAGAQQRDPELAAVGRLPLAPTLKTYAGGTEHADEDHQATASAEEAAAIGADANYGGGAAAAAAPSQRLYWG